MSPAVRQAYDEGRMAKHEGKPFSANPYPLSTAHSRAWSKGWSGR